MNRYLAMTKLGKLRKASKIVKLARDNAVSCSICGHGVRSHYVEGADKLSVLQLARLLQASVPVGTRKYCLGTRCRECEAGKK